MGSASMEPRSIERGKWLKRLPVGFQGHRASMEPRSIERGKASICAVVKPSFSASMEPRSIERGKYARTWHSLLGVALQWSRDQLNAESRCRRWGRTRRLMLQWSRDQLNAESCQRVRYWDRASTASMEPRSIERGKPSGSCGTWRVNDRLQWSRDQLNAERGDDQRREAGSRKLQWSRDQLNAESVESCCSLIRIRCFNGAAIN